MKKMKMKRKRNLKTSLLRLMRRMGMICKKKQPTKNRIRISKTLNPDGSVTDHDHITDPPLYVGSTFETELHIWKELHKDKFPTKRTRKSSNNKK